MRFVTFKRIFNEDPVPEQINPVLEYGLPVAAEPGVVYRAGSDDFGSGSVGDEMDGDNPAFPFFMQSMEEVGLMSRDGSCLLPLAVTGYSFPDMNALISESSPQMMDDLKRYACILEKEAENKKSTDSAAGFRKNESAGCGSKWPQDMVQAVAEGILLGTFCR